MNWLKRHHLGSRPWLSMTRDRPEQTCSCGPSRYQLAENLTIWTAAGKKCKYRFLPHGYLKPQISGNPQLSKLMFPPCSHPCKTVSYWPKVRIKEGKRGIPDSHNWNCICGVHKVHSWIHSPNPSPLLTISISALVTTNNTIQQMLIGVRVYVSRWLQPEAKMQWLVLTEEFVAEVLPCHFYVTF